MPIVGVMEQRNQPDYWSEHPKHPVKDWQYEVENGDTREGYWDWVRARSEAPDSKLYVVVYSHRHGIDAWPTFRTEAPGSDEIIEELRAADTWDERDDQDEMTYIEVLGPFQA